MLPHTQCNILSESEVTEENIVLTPEQYSDLLQIQHTILKMIGEQQPYMQILDMLCVLAEKLLPNSVASIMLKNQESGLMNVLSAPSVPQEGVEALANLTPGPTGGSCGNAIYYNKPQYVSNTFEDKRWEDLRNLAEAFNLCACWSMPVRDADGNSIGTFALSSFEHRSPSVFHKKVLQTAASIVTIILGNQESREKIKKMAYEDPLTKLANKTALQEALHRTHMEQTLLLINVNNFSYINTAYGFETGDKLLQALAKTFVELFNQESTFRINADEFAFLYQEKTDIVKRVAKIRQYFYDKTFQIDGVSLNISFTFGAAHGDEKLLRNAALALKQAKESGKNSLYIFDQDEENIDHKARKMFIEANNTLHNAFVEDRIVPFFQGIHDNNTNTISKYETLARIVEEDGTVVSPYKFLEPARLAGLLPEITRVMIEKSFAVMQDYEYNFSINITEDDLNQNYLLEYLVEKSSRYNIAPSRVILEILEGISANGKKNHIKQLTHLKQHGFSLAIDDFGSEYSNFERVLDLEIDFLKIDAKYIKDIDTNKKSYEIVKAISFFAKNVGIPCIAEFVHNAAVQKALLKLDIEYSQGYFFSEPSDKLS